MTPQEKFEKAKQRVLLDHRFFAFMMMRMKWIEDPTCKTAWTNGKEVGWNPAYIDTLSLSQTIFVVIHEDFHPIMKHHLRRGNRKHDLWCEACDYAINALIVRYGFEPPPGILLDPAFDGMSAEEIYPILEQRRREKEEEQRKQEEEQEQKEKGEDENSPEDSQESKDGDQSEEEEEGGVGSKKDKAEGEKEDNQEGDQEGDSEGSEEGEEGEGDTQGAALDEVRDALDDDGKELSEADRIVEEQKIDVAVGQAEKSAQKAGQGFNGMDRLVETVVKTETPWEQILSRYIYEIAKTRYDWCRPSRRQSDFFIPALHSYEAGNIVLVIDSSGSINGVIFNRFVAEMKTILENISSRLWVIVCDDQIQDAREIAVDELCELKPKGYRGTDFRPPFEWLEKEGIEPTVLVYLTDLECWAFPPEPNYPVLWAAYGWYAKDAKVPFGEKIILK